MAPVQSGAKKKRPPTFQHFPEKRARALKKSWVETAKIKSQWKAEKRKTNLHNAAPQIVQYDVEEDGDSKSEVRGDLAEPQSASNQSKRDPKTPVAEAIPHRDPQPSNSISLPKRDKSSHSNSQTHLRKGSSSHSSAQKPAKAPPASNGQAAKRTKQSLAHTRHGQPNMGLRMGAMLEKIKKDFA